MVKIAALCGSKGSGKSTIAKKMVNDHGYRRIAFADALKTELMMLTGVSYRYWYNSELKEVPIKELLGFPPREVMQRFGMYCRETYDADYWVRVVRKELMCADDDIKFVVDDLRMDNELEMLRAIGAKIYRIDRIDYNGDEHVSETEMKSWVVGKEIDAFFCNDNICSPTTIANAITMMT